MQRFSLCVFLATACLLLEGASTEHLVTCGAHVHRLECESGVISVDDAFYGRRNPKTCAGGKTAAELANTACTHSGALAKLKTRCNGKKVCELNSNVFSEDPCSDTFKYMETSYSCVPAIHRIVCEHSLANLHCEDGKVIHVLGADFGRRDHSTCSFRRDPGLLTKTDCSNPTNVLAENCEGKVSCEVRAAFTVVGEYCVDTSPYLEFSYICKAPQ